jgi:ABC-type sugar transport system ATPase subunit
MVRKLAAAGKSIIYVSHRLDEIFKITDRITVLRDGENQTPRKASGLNVNSLVELMLGRKLENMFPERRADHKRELLVSVRDLWPDGMLEPVSFEVYAGEILGLAGQLGSGTGEILAAIAGAYNTRSGVIEFGGETFLAKSPAGAIRRKIGYCSEDRKLDGLFLGRPIRENLTSPALETVSRLGWISGRREQRVAHDLAEKFTVDVSRLAAESGVLSGGNQQKVALGKWLAISPRLILVNEPTRGVDVGAKAEIYQKMRDLADEGAAIVFASTDMQEVTYLPDRVITFYRGMKIGGFDLADITTAGVLKEITDPFNETNL